MKKFNKNKQKGMTLLELIIAMSIGLILIIALATLMMASNRSSAQRTLTEMMDENARQLFNKLGNDITMAGYVDSWASVNRVDNSAAAGDENVARFAKMRKLSGLEGTNSGGAVSPDAIKKYTMLGYMSNGKLLPVYGCGVAMKSDELTCSNQTPSKQQSIRLSYEVISPSASGTPLPYGSLSTAAQEDATASDAAGTCRGESLNNALAANFSIISNTFSIGNVSGEQYPSDGKAIPSLKCNSRRYALDSTNEKPQDPTQSNDKSNESPLLQNVDQLVFRYIVTSENNAEEIKIRNSTVEARNSKAYLTSAEVEDTKKNPLGWSAVTGVEVCAVIGIERTNDQIKTEQVTGDLKEAQPLIPNCLREASNESTAAFAPGQPRGNKDDRYYKRYVRTFNIGNNLNLPMVNLEKVRASAK